MTVSTGRPSRWPTGWPRWLLATEDGTDVGTAIGVGGWHSPEGVARGGVRVVGDVRGRGVGSSVLAELSSWASSLGYAELMGPVKETDDLSLAGRSCGASSRWDATRCSCST
jgi:GNAT superfamily N-acetyltransferase